MWIGSRQSCFVCVARSWHFMSASYERKRYCWGYILRCCWGCLQIWIPWDLNDFRGFKGVDTSLPTPNLTGFPGLKTFQLGNQSFKSNLVRILERGIYHWMELELVPVKVPRLRRDHTPSTVPSRTNCAPLFGASRITGRIQVRFTSPTQYTQPLQYFKGGIS
jgi:hypothetical protein